MTFTGTLKPFQVEPVDRMIERQSLLVAFDMGLGKTTMTIAAIERLIDEGKVGGGFIVCGKSLKRQWVRMITKFTAGEANIIVASNSDTRRRHDQYVAYANGEAEYLIMNIEQVVNDWPIVSRLPRDFVVLDEAAAIKNFKPARSKKFKRLKAHYKWALTGQPVENRAEDLFSIMEWVDPEVLGDFATFDATFIRRKPWGTVRTYVNLPTLHKTMREAMVRCTRAEVKDQLPAVVEEPPVLVDFDIAGGKLYRTIRKELLEDLDEVLGFSTWDAASFYAGGDDSPMKKRGEIMSKLTCLRMLCDHPDLIHISADHRNGLRRGGIRAGSAYAADLVNRGLVGRLRKTPKLDATLEQLDEILSASRDNKVVLFSFFKDMLNILQEATAKMTDSVLFTGALTEKARGRVVDRFDTDPKCRLFLSSDAGGVGLDLPMANYLVSYDLPWSSGAWNQRNSRIIRLSSEFPQVTLLSMLMADSIEERQFDALQQKQKVASAIIDGTGWDDSGRLKMDLQSLKKFLQDRDV